MPSVLRLVWEKITAVVRSDRLDRDFEEELASHVDLATEDARRRGKDPEQARREALRRLGGIQRVRELHRDRRAAIHGQACARPCVRSENAPAHACLHDRGCDVPGVGHRREHCRLHDHQCRDAARASSASPGRARAPERHSSALLRHVPGFAGASAGVHRHPRDHERVAGASDDPRSSEHHHARQCADRVRVLELLRCADAPTAGRPLLCCPGRPHILRARRRRAPSQSSAMDSGNASSRATLE